MLPPSAGRGERGNELVAGSLCGTTQSFCARIMSMMLPRNEAHDDEDKFRMAKNSARYQAPIIAVPGMPALASVRPVFIGTKWTRPKTHCRSDRRAVLRIWRDRITASDQLLTRAFRAAETARRGHE